MSKTQSNRSVPKGASKQSRSTRKPRKVGDKYARTLNDNLSHIRFNTMATVPGMLDTDGRFRSLIIDYLHRHYRREMQKVMTTPEAATNA